MSGVILRATTSEMRPTQSMGGAPLRERILAAMFCARKKRSLKVSSTFSGLSEPHAWRATVVSPSPSKCAADAAPVVARNVPPPAFPCTMARMRARWNIARGMSMTDCLPSREPHVPLPTKSLSVPCSSAGGVPPSRYTAKQ